MIVSKPNDTDVVGKLIDVSVLNDVCIDEIDMDDENYFFLDKGEDDSHKFCGLLQLWKPVDPSKIGYAPLSAVDKYKLKGISKLVESQSAMWFGSFKVTNLSFIFCPDELMSGRIPSLNGM